MKRRLSLRDILLLTTGALTLLIILLVVREVYIEWRQLQNIEAVKNATLMSDKLFDATEKMSVERDVAFAMLYASDGQDTGDLRQRLAASRKEADAAFDTALAAMQQYTFIELSELSKNLKDHVAGIQVLRQQIDKAVLLPKKERPRDLAKRWYDEVTSLTGETQDLWTQFIRHFTNINPIVTQHLRYKHFLRLITDYTGRERSLIGRLLMENTDPTPEEIGQLLRWQGMIELSWKTANLLADQSGLFPTIEPAFKDAQSHYFTMYDMVRDIFYVPGARHGASYPISVDLWFELSTQASDSLTALKDISRQTKHAYLDSLEKEGKRSIALHLALLAFTFSLCFYCFWIIGSRVIRPIDDMVKALLDATQGKPVSFVPVYAGRQDEIGKLAEVLHVFQKNVEEIKHTSDMLKRYTSALERSNKELDDFAYIASHDLKEPLRGLFNHASFLIEDYKDKLDEEGVRRLHRLSHLAQRMERLVNDLLYFSRLGRQEFAIQSTNISGVIHDIENTLDVFLEEHKAKIVAPKPLPTITCDKPRVTEVFRNLITNAVKYNDSPEKIVEIGFITTGQSPDGAPCKEIFYVKDNGRGIAAEFHEEIFRIFKRLQNSSGKQEEGTGVGLTFVKKIVERHSGKIWLESTPGQGTTFYFTLAS
jgi:signal transduction histidine kinase